MPANRLGAFRRGYLMRLGALALLLLSFLMVIHGALLLPSHMYLVNHIAAEEKELETLSKGTLSAEEAQFEARAKVLSEYAERIEKLEKAPHGSDVVSKILQIPRGGVSVSSIAYTAPQGAKLGTVVLVGQADTRETLRRFQLALSSADFIASVELPVSAYAQEVLIPFSITLTLKKI